MSQFTNVYFQRTTGTPKQCYICYKPTTTVLATASAVDFLYTCDVHLTDHGFCTKIAPEKPSEAEIEKVKQEWEEQQRRKKEKAAAAKAKKEKDEADKDDKTKDKAKDEVKSSPSPPPPVAPAPAPKQTHEKFALHRDIYALRQREHRKRRQAAAANELGPRLPGAPTGTI